MSFAIELAPPKIVGEPSASFVKSSSAVLFGELNPENASTEYFFEYEPASICPTLKGCTPTSRTAAGESGAYGLMGVTQEATGLQPGRTYHYRLVAINEAGTTYGEEGTFTTLPVPAPTAQTGAYSQLTPTSATISGTVDPDGLPASYAFELGVYNGAATQYGVVFSGSTGAGTALEVEMLSLIGLQPGTTYYYRISIHSGYILNESHTLQGAPGTFTTLGLPATLASPTPLAMLPIPPIAFPVETKPSGQSKPLTNAQKLAKALKACRKDKRKNKRVPCEKQARKKYGTKVRKK